MINRQSDVERGPYGDLFLGKERECRSLLIRESRNGVQKDEGREERNVKIFHNTRHLESFGPLLEK